MSLQNKQADIIIVGAGPVGLFGVFACGQLGMTTVVIDALPTVGGQCTALYPEKPIYDIPGHLSISGEGLVGALLLQAASYQPEYILGKQVLKINEDDDGTFHIITEDGVRVSGKAVLIAAGAGAFGPNRPPLENIRRYENTSVFYHIKDPYKFKDKDVVIGGGGDSALDWTLTLQPIAKSVTLVHRRTKFKAHPDSIRKLNDHVEKGLINLAIPYQLSGLEGQGNILTGVVAKSLYGETEIIPADVLLPFYGLSTDLSAFATWDIAADKLSIPVNPLTQETKRTGIYAAGDVAEYDGKLKLILSGFSEITTAAHSAYCRVFPDQHLHFEHSTSKGKPGSFN